MSNRTDSAKAIQVTDMSKTFRLPHEKQSSIKSLLINFRKRRTYESQSVLNDISLDIEQGEFFGIVGRNGSGKSTLLKLLAGIYVPTKGKVAINGKLTPFIELGVGFNPELTGRENVFLNGSLLGFTRKEMEAMYQDIVDFSELERFMDQKLKNYSSGMQVRLAFSVAIRAESDILLIDEVLAVGDLDFQKKCYNYFMDLKKAGRTVVLVTHDMSAIRRFCTSCALIHDGKVKKVGKPDQIAELYEDLNLRAAENRLGEGQRQYKHREGSKDITINKVLTYDPKTGTTQNTFSKSENIGIRIVYDVHKDTENPNLSFIIQDYEERVIFAPSNILKKAKTKDVKMGETIIMEIEVGNIFTDGEYTLTVAAESTQSEEIYDRIEFCHRFATAGQNPTHALIHPPYELKLIYNENKG